jgi:hypothetical protein
VSFEWIVEHDLVTGLITPIERHYKCVFALNSFNYSVSVNQLINEFINFESFESESITFESIMNLIDSMTFESK